MMHNCVYVCVCVDYISFAAHTDYDGTSNFIREVKPPHIVCPFGYVVFVYFKLIINCLFCCCFLVLLLCNFLKYLSPTGVGARRVQ